MREYGAVSPKFWTGRTGRKLRGQPEAQILALYLMTAPGSTMTGVYYCPHVSMASETGLGIEGASKGLACLIKEGFCQYDEESETVFVVTMAEWQIGESLDQKDKRVLGLRKEVARMTPTALQRRFIDVYDALYHLQMLPKDGWPLEGASKGGRSQEQEQEQRQEQEQKERHTQSEASLQAPPEKARVSDQTPPEPEEKPSFAGTVCKSLRAMGILITPTNPELLDLIKQGVTIRELTDAGTTAREAGKTSAGYVFGIIRGQREDAKRKAALPSARASPGFKSSHITDDFSEIDYGSNLPENPA
jgi:hypothetical protein